MTTDVNVKNFRNQLHATAVTIELYFDGFSDERLKNFSAVEKMLDKAKEDIDNLKKLHVHFFKK